MAAVCAAPAAEDLPLPEFPEGLSVIWPGETSFMDIVQAGADSRVDDRSSSLAAELAEEMAPGAELAGWLSAVDVAELSRYHLAGVAAAWRRLAAWAQACELAAVAEMAARAAARDASVPLREDGSPAQVPVGAADEVALALGMSRAGGLWWTDLATTLAWRLPATLAALRAGAIDLPRAKLIAEATSPLDDGNARAVQDMVLPGASGQTLAQLRAALRKAVISVDKQAAERRRDQAERNAKVGLYSDENGTATLSGHNLPGVQSAAAMARLTALAKAMKAAGATDGIHLLRAKAFLGLLLGTLPLIPPADGCEPPEPPADRDPGPSGAPSPGNPRLSGGPRPGNTSPSNPDSGGSGPGKGGPSADGPGGRPGSGAKGNRPADPRPGSCGPGRPRPGRPSTGSGGPSSGEGPAGNGRPGAGPTDNSPAAGDTCGNGPAAGTGSGQPSAQTTGGNEPAAPGTPADEPGTATGQGIWKDEDWPSAPGPDDPGDIPEPDTRDDDTDDDDWLDHQPSAPPGGSASGWNPSWPRLPVPGETPTPGCAPLPSPGRNDNRRRKPLALPTTGAVRLTAAWPTLAGLSSEPGVLCWLGPITPATARLLARAAAADPACQWKLIVTSPDGRAAAAAHVPPNAKRRRRARRPPGPPTDGTADTAGLSPGAWAPCLISRITIIVPAEFLPGGPLHDAADAALRSADGDPLAELLHAALDAAQAAWQQAQPYPAGPGSCDHRLASDSYRLPPRLREYIEARDQTCRSPNCRQPAWRTDKDHTIPYHKGGRTCSCNTGPECRTHHQLKQKPGWHLEQPKPGTFTWTTPSGRTYTVTPPRLWDPSACVSPA